MIGGTSLKKIPTEEKVSLILDKFPAAADDDRLLILLLWKIYDGLEIPTELIKEILLHGTMPESITRAKRKCKSKTR
jgi:hypothetical protein